MHEVGIQRLTSIQHAIDIETTMRNGAMDIGIFAPVEMLSLEDGEAMMQDFNLALQGIGK